MDVELLVTTALYFVGAVVAFRVARMFTTPLLRWLGFYTYYAPMFFLQPFGRDRKEMHLGTLWDFLRNWPITPLTLMRDLARGLAGVAEDVRNGTIAPETVLRGTTYYLSAQTLQRYGFLVRKPYPLEYAAFALNYIEVCILKSLVTGRPTLVDVRRVIMVHIRADALVANAHHLNATARQLQYGSKQAREAA